MDGTAQAEAADDALRALVLAARVLGVPAELDALRHAHACPGGRVGPAELLRAARALGLRARQVRSDWAALAHTPLPALARLAGGRYAVLARADAERALVQRPGSAPTTLGRADFETEWSGELVLLGRRAARPGGAGAFGLAWFLPALWRHRLALGEVLLASLFLQLFALATPLLFQVVVDKVLVHRGLSTLDVLCTGLVLVSVFEVLLAGLRAYVFTHTANRLDVFLGAALYAHLLRLPLAWFEARRVGDTVARVRELETLRQFVTNSALTITVDLLFVLVFLAVMWLYSPPLTAVVLAALPLYALLAALVTPVLRRRLAEQFELGAQSQSLLVESIAGIGTLKAAAVEPQQQRRWEEALAAYLSAGFRAANLGNWAQQGAELVGKLVLAATLWLGARAVIEGALSVGMLVAFNMLAGRVTAPVLRLVQLWQEVQQARLSLQRLGDVLDAPTEPAGASGRAALPPLRGAIRFAGVSFRYRPEQPEVLRDLELDIPAGQLLGVVGASGSGKSTLAALVQRLHLPEAGRVLVDGVDLRQVDPAWLRRQIGVVLQENRLFHRSVRENIALRDPALPLERIVRAATLAGAHEFILGLPEGYDTLVGEQGCSLSGGQRQRIALARALVTEPRILILDEATSALDFESEALVQRNLRRVARGRTVLVVAHRLSTVREADRIVVLHGGRLVESGDHRSLLALKGHYARLHALQHGGPEAEEPGA